VVAKRLVQRVEKEFVDSDGAGVAQAAFAKVPGKAFAEGPGKGLAPFPVERLPEVVLSKLPEVVLSKFPEVVLSGSLVIFEGELRAFVALVPEEQPLSHLQMRRCQTKEQDPWKIEVQFPCRFS